MFLFYTLMCRNYQEYKWKSCWSEIGTFQKSVPELFSKMVTLRVQDCVKRKTLQIQSCREFHGKCSGHKIYLIPSPDGRDRLPSRRAGAAQALAARAMREEPLDGL
jgi:hypothetical protein